ncbi:sodium- and chloride-dependent GABA transporter ine-like isoform X2 [Copidosoma floridanum]|uniref:sodium- and chloride-dependent GABA transporter ine-like isoform X2 n=1 Tax=Copidosoma floridanum TaxID=29053 RepID=UPI000C6F6DDF|nr:sodium- and chloride-dependent GABA transporter ine-like isoform X2 [Copidosoma floridanum]
MEPAAAQSDKEEPVTKSPDAVAPDELPTILVVAATSSPPPPAHKHEPIVPNGNHQPQVASDAQQNEHGVAQPIVAPRTVAQAAAKTNGHKRKMSTMVEEDSSDDLDNNCPNRKSIPSARSLASSHADNDSDSTTTTTTYEERGRLLSAASAVSSSPPGYGHSSSTSTTRVHEATPISHHHHQHQPVQLVQSSRGRRNSPLVKRSRSSLNDSVDSFHEKSPLTRRPRDQLHQTHARRLPAANDCGCPLQQLPASRHCSRHPSMRSLKSSSTSDEHNYCANPHQHQAQQLYPASACNNSWGSILFPDNVHGMMSQAGRAYPPDSVSIRSLASIGMGSSDGRKLTIRRVPTSPSELLNMVHPPTPVEDDLSTCTSFDDPDAEDPEDYRQPRRPHWENKAQFVLACVSYSVGLGNVWRFPYLCYKSGGGVFLIPYFLILIVCGVPLLYMELSIGQFTRRGPIGALGQMCPLFKGAGLSSVVISFLMSTYHNVIIAYAIYYFFAGCRPIQPWSRCRNKWNSPDCWIPEPSINNNTRPKHPKIPAAEFFDNKVLQISSGIEEPGMLRWELAACLITAWVIVYFSIWKSIKSSARVRYITATLPFLLIFIFLTRSLTLEGADKGLQFFFRPDWELLKDAKVWVNAAAQIFNSIGIAFGSMICFASYNKFHNHVLSDAIAVSMINACSCLLVGVFAFATIGNIAVEQNMTVPEVLSDGPGLVFVVYPQALAKMPWSQLWSTLFFFMLVCLSLNSQFAIVEVVVTSIQDGFPKWVKKHLVCHEVLVLLVCFVSFLFGLPNITQGGIYFFQLVDHYAASISIMFLAFFEVIAISWFYGVGRLSSNVKEMTGRAPSVYFRFCWLIAAPLLIMSVWVFSLIDYEPPHYTHADGKYKYPWWAEALGWGIASLSLVCIPAFAVYVFFRAEGTTFYEKLYNSIKPSFEACEVCGQEYCAEPTHSTEDELLKEPLHEMNNVIQVVPSYQPVKTQS